MKLILKILISNVPVKPKSMHFILEKLEKAPRRPANKETNKRRADCQPKQFQDKSTGITAPPFII